MPRSFGTFLSGAAPGAGSVETDAMPDPPCPAIWFNIGLVSTISSPSNNSGAMPPA